LKEENTNWLCKRGFHKFVPRYELLPEITQINVSGQDNKVNLTIDKYIFDICERCGKIITGKEREIEEK